MNQKNAVILAFKLMNRCATFVDDINALLVDVDDEICDNMIKLVLDTLNTKFNKKRKEKK